MFALTFLVMTLFQPCVADVYLHYPPGNNNYGKDAGADGLFDSQVSSYFKRKNITQGPDPRSIPQLRSIPVK